jgi:hypothetical protein
MLEITVQGTEFWNEVTEEFVTIEPCTLILEHSLISLAKWESKWEKPFLNSEKTVEETQDYIRCMTTNRHVDPKAYLALTNADVAKVNDYIEKSMTATTINERRQEGQGRRKPEVMTAEIIYYYMIALGIPFECEKWHLNRLLTLIRVCNIKNAPKQKMSKSAAAKQQRALNAQRRARSGSRG